MNQASTNEPAIGTVTDPSDFLLSSYDFNLPEGLIAQQPADIRDSSRLMVHDRRSSETVVTLFSSILEHLPENCLLVANNSRVLPARLYGSRSSGGKVEFLLLTPLPLIRATSCDRPENPDCQPEQKPGWQTAEVEGLLRSSKQVRLGERVRFGTDLAMTLAERAEFGRCKVRLCWRGCLATIFRNMGSLPLPPYIKRPAGETDQSRYQTIYARDDKTGSVAAPTAGLHFTPGLREELVRSGRQWTEATLYVGYGTFSPVRTPDIRDHVMHAEYVDIPPSTARAVNQAKKDGRAVIAVGTTSTRLLEGAWQSVQEGLRPSTGPLPDNGFQGWINTFLYPGKKFGVIDGLLTNFHLPQSSLLMLVSALTGRKTLLDLYQAAITERFRFFSYGDAMLIL